MKPIAYTYNADVHCPECAEARFGRSNRGFIAEGVEDGKGNEVGAVFDGAWEMNDPGDGLYCGDCGEEIIAPEGRN